jgi:hypothetical protein
VPRAAYDSFLEAMPRCGTGLHELGCFHRAHLNPAWMSTVQGGNRQGAAGKHRCTAASTRTPISHDLSIDKLTGAAMPVTRLAHYSIRTADLEQSRQFYTRIPGFREGFRPPFDFPGIWLYLGDDESEFGVVHISVHE